MKFASFKNQKAFSLVELMIVVGIIGILATLALPRFKQFQAKAKMGEAKNLLVHIYTLEQTYALGNNAYVRVTGVGADLTSPTGGNICPQANATDGAALIGFKVDPCSANAPVPRYLYSVPTIGAGTFVAQAVTGSQANNRVCPGNAAHYIAINESKNIWGGAGGRARAPTGSEPVVGLVCRN